MVRKHTLTIAPLLAVVFLLVNCSAQGLPSLEEAQGISKATGKPILAMAGQDT